MAWNRFLQFADSAVCTLKLAANAPRSMNAVAACAHENRNQPPVPVSCYYAKRSAALHECTQATARAK